MRNRFALAAGAGLVAVALALGGVAAGRAVGPAGVTGGSAVAAPARNAMPGGMMALRYAGWPMTMASGWAMYPPGIHARYCGSHGAVIAQRQVGS